MQGVKGDTGATGASGAAGADGADGADGAERCQRRQGAADRRRRRCRRRDGAKGDTGAGATGAQGAQGEAGSAGPQGNVGPAGPEGDVGPAGPEGDVGPAGPAGDDGSAGPQGEVGPAGPQGVPGAPGLTWRGTWSAATAYAVNDAVTYQGSSYRRLVAGTTGGDPASDAVNWASFAIKGDTGDVGSAGPTGNTGATGARRPSRWQGAWVSGTTYAINDAVTDNGSSYRRKVAGAGTTAPGSDGTNWETHRRRRAPTARTARRHQRHRRRGRRAGLTCRALAAATAYAVNDAVTYNGSARRVVAVLRRLLPRTRPTGRPSRRAVRAARDDLPAAATSPRPPPSSASSSTTARHARHRHRRRGNVIYLDPADYPTGTTAAGARRRSNERHGSGTARSPSASTRSPLAGGGNGTIGATRVGTVVHGLDRRRRDAGSADARPGRCRPSSLSRPRATTRSASRTPPPPRTTPRSSISAGSPQRP